MTHSWKWKNCTFWKQFKKFLLHHKSWRMVKYFAVFWHLTQVFKVTSSESEGNIIIIIMKRVKEVATQSIVLVSSHILHHTPELRELRVERDVNTGIKHIFKHCLPGGIQWWWDSITSICSGSHFLCVTMLWSAELVECWWLSRSGWTVQWWQW